MSNERREDMNGLTSKEALGILAQYAKKGTIENSILILEMNRTYSVEQLVEIVNQQLMINNQKEKTSN